MTNSISTALMAPNWQFRGVAENAQSMLMNQLDADKSAELDASEVEALGPGRNNPAEIAAVDRDGDGQLNLTELQRGGMLDQQTFNALLGAQEEGQGVAGWLVSKGDANGDGALSLDEFRTVAPQDDPAAAPADAADTAQSLFAAADADGDGQVTGAELNHAMNTFSLTSLRVDAQATASRAMTSFDTDASGGLSQAELQQAASDTDTGALFSAVDTNGDGQITSDEFDTEIAAHQEFYDMGVTRAVPIALPTWTAGELQAPAAPESQPAEVISEGQRTLFRLLHSDLLRLTDQLAEGATGSSQSAQTA